MNVERTKTSRTQPETAGPRCPVKRKGQKHPLPRERTAGPRCPTNTSQTKLFVDADIRNNRTKTSYALGKDKKVLSAVKNHWTKMSNEHLTNKIVCRCLGIQALDENVQPSRKDKSVPYVHRRNIRQRCPMCETRTRLPAHASK